MNANRGYKSPSFLGSKDKTKGASRPRCSVPQKGKNLLFNINTDFPDLMIIDKMTTLGVLHPQIPISQLQTVGQEVCGLLPSEVAVDKLLQPEDAGASRNGGSNIQVVTHG
jgi:hypothetical protein